MQHPEFLWKGCELQYFRRYYQLPFTLLCNAIVYVFFIDWVLVIEYIAKVGRESIDMKGKLMSLRRFYWVLFLNGLAYDQFLLARAEALQYWSSFG